jgi:hypothetical protein
MERIPWPVGFTSFFQPSSHEQEQDWWLMPPLMLFPLYIILQLDLTFRLLFSMTLCLRFGFPAVFTWHPIGLECHRFVSVSILVWLYLPIINLTFRRFGCSRNSHLSQKSYRLICSFSVILRLMDKLKHLSSWVLGFWPFGRPRLLNNGHRVTLLEHRPN